jgi:predicted ATPase/GAF domain-containing protein
MRLPAGYSLTGVPHPAMGGYTARVADKGGATFVARSMAPNCPIEAALQYFDAELVAASTTEQHARPARKLEAARAAWLLYEGVTGAPIQSGEAWGVTEFWELAIPVVTALSAHHQNGRVHGRLEPGCLWWDREAQRVSVLGMLKAEDSHLTDHVPAAVDTAPELVGKGPLAIQPSADVYSLGCVFYRLLAGRSAVEQTGNLAFDTAANAPPPLDVTRVPRRLAQLIERMTSKSASARPNDCSEVLREFDAIRTGSEPPRAPLQWVSPTLVGRTEELELLLGYAQHVQAGGSGVVLVSGEPGVGKSHLLSELARRLEAPAFLVARGKFEQAEHGQPYSALLAGCRNALSHVLSGDERVFESVQERLTHANATLLGVLAPYLPELRHLCTELPDASEAGPSENRNRFNRAAFELLASLASPALPFVLVLDDVHWTDRATAELLRELCESGLPAHSLMLFVYRENEAEQNVTLAKLLETVPVIGRVALARFRAAQTRELCEALIPNCDDVDRLGASVHFRSKGNALYCVELLKNLVGNGQLVRVGGRWRYLETETRLPTMSETVVELIRQRFNSASAIARYVLGAAACIGYTFPLDLLGVATNLPLGVIEQGLVVGIEQGLIERRLGEAERFVFCHDRIQEAVIELARQADHAEIHLRLGRHFRTRIDSDRAALFHCLDHLNAIRQVLRGAELRELYQLNFEGAKLARRAIAYQRAIQLIRIYLEDADLSSEARFEATLLLAECFLLLSTGKEGTQEREAAQRVADDTLAQCALLATEKDQQLSLLQLRLAVCVHNQSYDAGTDLGLAALQLLGRPLPKRPSIVRVVARLLGVMARMSGRNPEDFASRPNQLPAEELVVFDILMRLSAAAYWASPLLGILGQLLMIEMTLRYGNGPQSSMGYAGYGLMCHMRRNYETAIRYGELADTLAVDHGIYARSMVRFQVLTFYGAFRLRSAEILRGYDNALKDCVAHGELIASHLIDGAVTTLTFCGPKLPKVADALRGYEQEARRAGAGTSLEMIAVASCWQRWLAEGAQGDDRLRAPVKNASFAGIRDLLRMQVEYLWGNDEVVMELAAGLRRNTALQGNPLHLASYAIFLTLASTRKTHRLGRAAREAIGFLRELDAVNSERRTAPRNFSAATLLVEGIAVGRRDLAKAVELITEAASVAASAEQELLRAVCLERLAQLYGEARHYTQFVEYLRNAAQSFQRFGATAKVTKLIEQHPGIDWTHITGRTTPPAEVPVEGVMRAASAIAEVTKIEELGPTLLRVIATTAGAMRAFLFAPIDGKLTLVAGCERDRPNPTATTGFVDLDPEMLALRPVRYVERCHEAVELPRDWYKFTGDKYLEANPGLRGLLCVPLMYRGAMVAILYLENSSNAESFSADDQRMVTLLGKQAAIALTNADNHRLEVEAIQSKVNPHFLYNALSVIAELIGRAPEEAEQAVFKLTRIYRYMLSAPANQRVPLDQELALVRDYLELEKARFGERLRVTWNVDSEVSMFQVPALLIQPLAENAVHHGIRRQVNGGTVSITARREGDSLVLKVEDDGPGWYDGNGGTGFGLRSVRRRLELVYGERSYMNIIKREGVAVELMLPW